MDRVELRLVAADLTKAQLMTLLARALTELPPDSKSLAATNALIAAAKPVPQWAVQGVLTSDDICPFIFEHVVDTHGPLAARVCHAWRRAWRLKLGPLGRAIGPRPEGRTWRDEYVALARSRPPPDRRQTAIQAPRSIAIRAPFGRRPNVVRAPSNRRPPTVRPPSDQMRTVFRPLAVFAYLSFPISANVVPFCSSV